MAQANLKVRGKYDNAVGTFIDAFWKEKFRSPTIREITAGVNSPTTSVISLAVKRIAKARGDLLVTDGSARGIIPLWVRKAIQGADTRGSNR